MRQEHAKPLFDDEYERSTIAIVDSFKQFDGHTDGSLNIQTFGMGVSLLRQLAADPTRRQRLVKGGAVSALSRLLTLPAAVHFIGMKIATMAGHTIALLIGREEHADQCVPDVVIDDVVGQFAVLVGAPRPGRNDVKGYISSQGR